MLRLPSSPCKQKPRDSFEPGILLLEAHSTSGLASLWLLVGPLLFSFSFRCSRRATSRVLHIVRTGHVVGWAFSAPPTLFTMIQI
jgi:hypothetical protein